MWGEIKDHARLRFPTGDSALRYNSLQKISYFGVVFVLLPLAQIEDDHGLAAEIAGDVGAIESEYSGFERKVSESLRQRVQAYGLEEEVKVNLEANHATLAGHSFGGIFALHAAVNRPTAFHVVGGQFDGLGRQVDQAVGAGEPAQEPRSRRAPG